MKKTLILILIIIVLSSCEEKKTKSIEKDTITKVEKVIGFNSLPSVMIGSGSMGALAGIVHGWTIIGL